MTRLTRHTRGPLPLLLALVTLATACGGAPEPELPPAPPAFSVSGQLNPAPGGARPERVRLALAWYPSLLAGDAEQDAAARAAVVVSGDAGYRGDLAQGFRFDVREAPPAHALAALGEGVVGRGAFGMLLAYEDRNANGRLDPIPADGAPVDRVLGASLLQSPESAFAVLYVEDAQPEGSGLRQGLNLLTGRTPEEAVQPAGTRVTLQLTEGGPMHDALVCEAGWLTFLFQPVCGLDGTGPERTLAVGGRVVLDGERLDVELEVQDGGAALADAQVSLDAQALVYDAGRGRYVLPADAALRLAPGATFQLTVRGGGQSVGHLLRLPGEFALTARTAGGQVASTGSFTVAWEGAADATGYFVEYGVGSAQAGTWVEADAREVSFEGGPLRGEGWVRVEARLDATDASALVTTALVRERAVTFVE